METELDPEIVIYVIYTLNIDHILKYPYYILKKKHKMEDKNILNPLTFDKFDPNVRIYALKGKIIVGKHLSWKYKPVYVLYITQQF